MHRCFATLRFFQYEPSVYLVDCSNSQQTGRVYPLPGCMWFGRMMDTQYSYKQRLNRMNTVKSINNAESRTDRRGCLNLLKTGAASCTIELSWLASSVPFSFKRIEPSELIADEGRIEDKWRPESPNVARIIKQYLSLCQPSVKWLLQHQLRRQFVVQDVWGEALTVVTKMTYSKGTLARSCWCRLHWSR